jgi:uncharacterized protein with PIN domain
MKFVCDDNLGRLARWLRTLGFDTVFHQDFSDTAVLTCALNEQRTILTRDTRLAGKALARELVLLSSSDPLEQLQEVIRQRRIVMRMSDVFTRCPCCNLPVEKIDKHDYAAAIPAYVYQTINHFTRCTACARIFWRGTHVQRMIDYLRTAGITIG